MAQTDELRLIARVARMYYEWDMRQSTIAEQLGLSQATVSRLLARAQAVGVVRITVNIPRGVYSELEENLIQKYGLRDAIIVDSMDYDDEKNVGREIGAAGAYYLENIIRHNEVIGISSWSASLLSLVDAMHSVPRKPGVQVVQILGGVGNPSAQAHASHLTTRLADLVNGMAVFLPAPGVVGSAASLEAFYADGFVRSVVSLFEHVTTALVGIGAVEPSHLLAASGNIFTEKELELLHKHGAVGDILLRFYDANGKPIEGLLNSRVISMSLEQLRGVHRAIAVAGGRRKYYAILGALKGKLINILVTDHYTATRLIQEA